MNIIRMMNDMSQRVPAEERPTIAKPEGRVFYIQFLPSFRVMDLGLYRSLEAQTTKKEA